MKKLPQMHHHKASNRARVYFKGKHHYLGKWASPEANVNYQNFLRQIDEINAPIVKGGGLPACVAAGKYLDYASEYFGGKGEYNNLKSTLGVFIEYFKWEPITEIGPLKITKFMEYLASQKLPRIRINRILQHIKRMNTWLVERELVGGEKFAAIQAVKSLKAGRTPAIEMVPVAAVKIEVVEQTLKAIRKPLCDMIQIQLLTAMRPNEVCNLNFNEIDQAKAVWIYSPAKHKTSYRGHKRQILIGPEAQALLRPYSFLPRDKPIFYTTKDLPFDAGTYGRAILEHNKANGIAHWMPNQLRHAAATRLVKEFGWQAARLILGHKTFDTTMIYAEENLDKISEIIGRIG